jgi:DNA-binding MarR family transcriptional regulator
MSIREKLHQRQFENSAQEAILSLLFAAGNVRQALGEVCAAHGITHDQYNVLRILRGVHPNGHPRYEIAARLIERAPDVTRLLDRLERQGLIERTRSDEDRRLSLSRITADGLHLLDAMAPEILAVHERYAGNLTEVERQELVRLCGCLLT